MSIHTSSSIICSCAFPSLRCSQRSNLREKTEELRTSERPQRSAAALRLDLHFSTIMDLHYSAIIHNEGPPSSFLHPTQQNRPRDPRIPRSRLHHWLPPVPGTQVRGGAQSLYLKLVLFFAKE